MLSILLAFLVSAQSASAESMQYYLERVAIHARLLQSKLSTEPAANGERAALQSSLASLLKDLNQWEAPGAKVSADEVRGGIDGYRQVLMTAAPAAQLDVNQSAALSLLTLEMEQASSSIAGGIPKDSLGKLGLQTPPSRSPAYWGGYGPWGGYAGPWGTSCDPLGPYFGRPLSTGYCPYYW